MTDQKNKKRSAKEDEEELQELLEIYLKKSEQLEEREGRVLRQIELMQSTVSSLQAWNDSRKTSLASRNSVHLSANEIEEETKKIKEETMRIQEEIIQKMADNKLLRQEIDRRKLISPEIFISEPPKQEKPKPMKETPKKEGPKNRALERHLQADNFDLDVKFFDQKVNQLKEIEKKLRKESELKALESKRRQQELLDRIKVLEKDTDFNKTLISNLGNSLGKLRKN